MSASDSTIQHKPAKPYPEFPLTAHPTGRWCKKIRGKLCYFGKWDDPDGALAKYLDQKDALHAGVTPADTSEGLTVYLLCGKFLTAKKRMVEGRELSPRSFADYAAVCKLLLKVFGKQRLVTDLRPDDFARLRHKMAKTWGPVRLAAEIVRTRTPFHWAFKSALLDKPMVFGEGFKQPSQKTRRLHRAAQGAKMFEAEEVRRMLDAAKQPLKTMILLGINCGYGNSDVATLPLKALDLDAGWIRHARPKTGIDRRCLLWRETVEALREWLTDRPKPTNEADAELVFITQRGGAWQGDNQDRPLTHEVRKLLDKLGINGHRNFYCLRHGFQTVGDESRDFLAVRSIMGHASSDIADAYRERMSDERLRAVTDHVRAWLSGPAPGKRRKPVSSASLRVYSA